MTRPGGAWRNWGRSARARPQRTEFPASADAVQRAVQAAIARDLRVKAVGSGHSFSEIAVAPGVLLDLSDLTGLVHVDRARLRATFLAGTRLWQVPAMLAPYGLAMQNLGDIDRQSLSGAISTGTHGTGVSFGSLSTQVTAITLIDGAGARVRIDETNNPELLPAVALGLGALGVITEITLQCVPAFLIAAVERPEPLAEVLHTLPERVGAADHFEFYWFPHTDVALTKSQQRLPGLAARNPLPQVGKWIDESLLSNGAFRVVCAVGTVIPAVIPPFSRLAVTLTGDRSYTDWSHRVLTQRRTVRFREMEYALPVERIPDAFRAIQRLIRQRGLQVSFPLEVRFAAADELWMSPSYQRVTGFIAVHRYWRESPDEYFRAVQDIMRAHGGRPHWGKMHTLNSNDLKNVYPRFDDFRAVRDRFDPSKRFGNRHLTGILGE